MRLRKFRITTLHLKPYYFKTTAHAVVVCNTIYTLSATDAGSYKYFIAWSEILDLHPHFGYLTYNVAPGYMGHWNFYTQSLSNPYIQMIDCACLYLNQHLIWRYPGFLHICVS